MARRSHDWAMRSDGWQASLTNALTWSSQRIEAVGHVRDFAVGDERVCLVEDSGAAWCFEPESPSWSE